MRYDAVKEMDVKEIDSRTQTSPSNPFWKISTGIIRKLITPFVSGANERGATKPRKESRSDLNSDQGNSRIPFKLHAVSSSDQ